METDAIKTVVREVMKEYSAANNDDRVSDKEHYLHHIWLRDHIKTERDIGIIARESAIKWGVPAMLGGVLWALWQLAKAKLTGQ